MATDRSSSDRISMLYVDDEEELLELAMLYIGNKEGVNVDIAPSASQGLRMMSQRRYDVVVSDYQMPDMDGIQFLKFLRSTGDSIPFIIFTGRGREEVAIEALNAGADFYIQKGGNPRVQYAELLNMVRQVSDRKRSERMLCINNHRVQTMMEGSPILILSVDSHGTVMEINRNLQRLLGLEPEDCIGHHYTTEVRLPYRSRSGEDLIAKALAGSSVQMKVEAYVDGRAIPLYVVVKPVRDPEGTVNGAMLFGQDHSSLYETSMALADVEADFRILFEESVIGVAIAGSDGRLRRLNDVILRLFGAKNLDMDDLRSVDVFKVIPATSEIWDDVRSGKTRRIEWHVDFQSLKEEIGLPLDKKGELWLDVRISPRFLDFPDKTMDGYVFHVMNITRLKRLLEQTELARRNLEVTLSSIGDAVLASDRDGHVTLLNESAKRILGIGQDAVGKSLETVLDLRDLITGDGPMGIMEAVLSTKRPVHGEEDASLITDSGQFWINYTASPIADPVLGVIGAVFAFQDVTEKHEFLKRLENSEKRYRDLFQNLPFAYAHHRIVLDEEGKPVDYVFLKMNEMFEDITGMKASQCLGKRILDLYPALEDVWVETYGRVALSGEPEVIEEYSGTLGKSFRVYAYSPAPGEFVTLFHDISERVALRRNLSDSEARYRWVFENSGTAMFVMQKDGAISMYNSRFQAFCPQGFIPERVSDIVDHVQPTDRKRLECFFKQDLLSDLPEVIDVNMDCDGTIRNMVFTRSHLKELNQAIVSVDDITDTMRTIHSMDMANKKLNLLSSITRHDILNLMMIMRGYLDILELPSYSSEAGAIGDKMASTLNRMERLIRFTKEYEEIGIRFPSWMPLSDCMDVGTELDVSISPRVSRFQIFADPMLPKVFDNLYQNSLRYGGSIRQVQVDALETPDGLSIVWQDDGRGVPEKHKEAIFQRGFGNNTGLGLFLAQNILDITDITIKECGVEGEGARFEMLVPSANYRLVHEKPQDDSTNR